MASAKDKLKASMGSGFIPDKKRIESAELAMSTKSSGSTNAPILLSTVELNPDNLWAKDDIDEEIAKLADAIKRSGLLHNIVVSQREDGTMMLLSGERRVKALRMLQAEAASSDGKTKWDRVQAQTYIGLDEIDEQIIMDEANIMVRGSTGDSDIMQKCISRYLENLKKKYNLSQTEAEAILKSKSNMGKSTLARVLRIEHELSDELENHLHNGILNRSQAVELCRLDEEEQRIVSDAIDEAFKLSNGDEALKRTYTTRVIDRAITASQMSNGKAEALAEIAQNIIPPAPVKPAADVATRSQKATILRKYDKMTKDLKQVNGSKRRITSMRKMEASDDVGSIIESLEELAKEASALAATLRGGK